MVFALLFTSILLIISSSVYNLFLKEILFSGAARESQFAFYAADSGAECALYYDLKWAGATGEVAFPHPFDNSITFPPGVTCNGFNLSTSNGFSVDCMDEVGTDLFPTTCGSGNHDGTLTTFSFPIDPIALYEDEPCASVTVYKYKDPLDLGNPDKMQTRIISAGYNRCGTDDERRIERAIRIIY